MPVEEFARLYYAMSRVLEDATENLGVSKRAGIVLWLVASEGRDGEMENHELVKKFGAWHMSKTHEGASRDVSVANGELIEKDWLAIKRGPYRVRISDEGKNAAQAFLQGIEEGVAKLAILPEQKNLIRSLILGMPPRISAQRDEKPSSGSMIGDKKKQA